MQAAGSQLRVTEDDRRQQKLIEGNRSQCQWMEAKKSNQKIKGNKGQICKGSKQLYVKEISLM